MGISCSKKLTITLVGFLKNINEVLQHYGSGEVKISRQGSIKFGRVTIQRKGGDRGRQTANMLQFKK